MAVVDRYSQRQIYRVTPPVLFTVTILVVISTTIPLLLVFFTTVSSKLLDENIVTHIMCIANLNLLQDSVVTYDERVVQLHW